MSSGRPTVLAGAWRAMVDRAGGVQELADELLVHRVTLTRWATGKTRPHPLVVAEVVAWCRRQRPPVAEPWT